MNRLLLGDGWQLKERDPALPLADDFRGEEGWISARVPGCVHWELQYAGLIPDPFFGDNERLVQWVGERDWLYRCTFSLPAAPAGPVDLVCDGLDTIATVLLNGQRVLASDNMFVPARAAVGPLLRAGDNELWLLFESALRRGKELEAGHQPMRVWNGDASRVYVRKAQYHWGWDWGPCLMTAGPYRPVRLESYEARIADLHCPVALDEGLGQATLSVRLSIEGAAAPLAVELLLRAPDGGLLEQAKFEISGSHHEHSFRIADPQLWWPHGQGDQPRYQVEALLRSGGAVLDRRELALGLRRVRLLQEPVAGEPGKSFVFEINGRELFCGGANWIPADSLLPRVDGARYRALLQLAREAGLLMLRVWGGGIYEEDLFYDLCDELGILVWQDFMFACGLYPGEAWFLDSVRKEAEAQLRRLRHHPSIVLWCGNNEDYSIASSHGAYGPPQQRSPAAPPFPARPLYEDLLAEVCAALDPERSYWPGSPYSSDADLDPSDGFVGDRHTWEVWHGKMADYQDYGQFAGRFVSEFGMQALPDLATVASFTPPEERHPGSATLLWHNKAEGGPERLRSYIDRNLQSEPTLTGQIYASQLVQAEALGWAYRTFRRRFGAPGRRRTAGALVWQWNDCWPVISWAIVDHALRRKPSFYVLRRELQQLVVGLAAGAGPGGPIEAWVVNGTGAEIVAELELRCFSLAGEAFTSERRALRLLPNQVTEVPTSLSAGGLVHRARLLVDGEVVSRAALWPEPLRELPLLDPVLKLARLDEERIVLRVARPAKGVLLGGVDGLSLSDNMLDLFPDEERVLVARGLGEGAMDVRWLGKEES